MLIERTIRAQLVRLFRQYPVVTLTGPRQSGKTTLCRATFPDLPYINLERPDIRESVSADPLGFLRRHQGGAVIDEIQRIPDLVSYIQADVDEVGENGRFVLTGSEQFRVSESISQSLAGRTAILRLLPLSIPEVKLFRPSLTIDEMLQSGFYPRIYDQQLDPAQSLADYFETYVERDVRRISNVRDLSTFQRFVRLCAGRIGQLLNLHSLGNDAGISHPTARHWINVLEASFVVFQLRPYHPNVSKRLIKSPKLYFYDVGLAAWLLGIDRPEHLRAHPLRGALFENLVIAEVMKHCENAGSRRELLFYRDAGGLEIDLLYPVAGRFVPIEIKSSETVTSAFFDSLSRFRRLVPDEIVREILVYGGGESFERSSVQVTGVKGLARALDSLDRG